MVTDNILGAYRNNNLNYSQLFVVRILKLEKKDYYMLKKNFFEK